MEFSVCVNYWFAVKEREMPSSTKRNKCQERLLLAKRVSMSLGAHSHPCLYFSPSERFKAEFIKKKKEFCLCLFPSCFKNSLIWEIKKLSVLSWCSWTGYHTNGWERGQRLKTSSRERSLSLGAFCMEDARESQRQYTALHGNGMGRNF